MKSFFRLIIFTVLFFSILALVKDIYNQYNKFEEIRVIEQEAERIKNENTDLVKEFEEKKTPFTLEKEARDKLGYKKEGDTLYVVDVGDKQASRKEEAIDNWKEWVDLFFK